MRLSKSVLIAVCLFSALLIGCEAKTAEEPVAAVPSPGDAAAVVPAALFEGGAPDGAVALIDAKNGAKPGRRTDDRDSAGLRIVPDRHR